MMPAAEAARRDIDPLDADVGPIFRLELDPVAIPLHVVVQVPGGESRRGETDPRRAESDARKRSEAAAPTIAALNFFLKRNTRIGSTSSPYFDRVGESPTPCNIRRKDSRKPWSSSAC